MSGTLLPQMAFPLEVLVRVSPCVAASTAIQLHSERSPVQIKECALDYDRGMRNYMYFNFTKRKIKAKLDLRKW